MSCEISCKGFELAKKAKIENVVAIRDIDGVAKDMSADFFNEDVEFIDKASYDGLTIVRHSTAHLLAAAVKRLYPNALFTIGPAIENGFYYDIDFKGVQISENDFAKIEAEMNSIIKEDLKFVRKEISKSAALQLFSDNKYKVELIQEIPEESTISIYEFAGYTDLCKGPHVPSARYLKNFKLTKIGGAYWRADQKREQLTRIYGTAWDTKESLEKWFKFIEEAERRDHKKICKAMDLCHFDSILAPGAPFYHPKGWMLFRTFESWLREMKINSGYIEVSTPRVMNRVLWETSGHWEKYGEHNYSGTMEDSTQFCVKPMNCPGGVLIYKSSPKSYKDLPIRMAEFGRVNRYEASGSLNGLLRVREFTQDDAHIFCTLEQAEQEIVNGIALFDKIYGTLGFNRTHMEIALSTRPEKRIGSEEVWDASEKFLMVALEKLGIKYKLQPGEGAFYGPKLEFGFKDAIGRSWQIGTIQLDMNLPMRFEMDYVGADGKKHEPVMLHMACFGSMERFLGMYIEHCEGKFPLWVNPVHGVIINVNDTVNDYCEKIAKEFKDKGLRFEMDLSNNAVQGKIKLYSEQRVPFIIVIGGKEKDANSVTIRTIGSESQKTLSVSEFLEKIQSKINNKDLDYVL